ncbi:MAG: YHYH protein [Acidimicrobiales bacterium]
MMHRHTERSAPTTSSTSISAAARLAIAACCVLLPLSACGGNEPGDGDSATEAETDGEPGTESESPAETTTAPDSVGTVEGCDEVAALFVTRGSANPDLDAPEVDANCAGDDIVVTSNGIPDYTYIETSPGQPTDRDHTFTIPATPTRADEVTDVPALGTAGVTLGGIPIFGPTEGTGGDVESLPGILSDCGSHNGPSGFHIHLILTSSETDCLFTPDEVAAQPQLVGYAFDGFPIYTGADQYTSSWQLTDESLFATDTWAAHSYVEGSGDLDQCNGRTDDDGSYAYYTTATFPYILGCFAGVVDLDTARGDDGADGGDRPERPEGDDERPERPEADGDRPERPEGQDDAPDGGAGA